MRRRPSLAAAALALAVSGSACGAAAEDETPRNQVAFSVERQRDVENDWLTAVVATTHEDADPAAVADRVNRDMAWGLEQARGATGVEARTGGYSTHGVHDRASGQIRRWRGSQTLVLESGDAKALTALIGTLQQKLQVQSLAFGISTERRREVEAELLDEALAAFRARAERIREKLGARSYEIVRVDLDSHGVSPPPMAHARVMAAESAPAPPALEGGTSELRAVARATIELGF